MSLFYIKSILATFFILAGLIAVICMFTLMGRTERKVSPAFLRRTHKIAGGIFAILMLVLTYYCIRHVAFVGDQLSLRAVFHAVLALGLIVVIAMKIAIVQFYKEFLRFVPTLGMIVFALAFVVYFTSAGYFFLRDKGMEAASEEVVREPEILAEGNLENGRALYAAKCSFCHHPDREDSKVGPGLKDVLEKEQLPYSGRPANAENVRKQLKTPVAAMPSFESLSQQEIADLLTYLETL